MLLNGALATVMVCMPGPQADPDALLADLARADQAQRAKPPTSEAEAVAMRAADNARRARAHEILLSGAPLSPKSYDRAALLFQHGETDEDYALARELALLACFHGASYGNMPMLAEDRLLLHIGQAQRFGSQFGSDGQLLPPPPVPGPWAVTDAFRLDVFLPPLDGTAQASANSRARITQALDLKDGRPVWKDLRSRDVQAILARCEARKTPVGRVPGTLLELYREDRLKDPSEYRRAAALLLRFCREANAMILANEWAALAVMRRDSEAWRVFADTWDAYLAALGRPPRYRGSIPSIPALAPLLNGSHGQAH